jgi:transposase
MTGLHPSQAREWREGRRLRAWELYEKGWTQAHIAEALGATQGAVSQWIARAKADGVEALAARKRPGAVPKLTAEQKAAIPALLLKGAEVFGYRGDLWTRMRIAEVIEREYGHRYSDSQVGRLLKDWGWTLQKPAKRAKQRDDEKVEHWKTKVWPRIKKKR